MRAIRNILHFALILAILSTGMPLYHPGDANRDDRVDLADAILRVQGVARTAEQPADFKENLEDALITLTAVAGFSKVIKATADKIAASPKLTLVIAAVFHLIPAVIILFYVFSA